MTVTATNPVMRAVCVAVILIACVGSASAQQHSKAYLSAEQKIKSIEADANGQKPQTVELTAQECSAYITEGGVNLPTGVERVSFTSIPGEITAVTRVDFDKITAGKSSMNPLMMLFTGVHDVTTKATAQASGGHAQVDIQSVEIDGVTVPRMALDYFVQKYIQPKYGKNLGMNNTFALPAHIDTATVGENQVTVTQK